MCEKKRADAGTRATVAYRACYRPRRWKYRCERRPSAEGCAGGWTWLQAELSRSEDSTVLRGLSVPWRNEWTRPRDPNGGRSFGLSLPNPYNEKHRARRDGRVVDGGGLENRWTGNGPGGSNPSPSANLCQALASLAASVGKLARQAHASLAVRLARPPGEALASLALRLPAAASAKTDLMTSCGSHLRCRTPDTDVSDGAAP